MFVYIYKKNYRNDLIEKEPTRMGFEPTLPKGINLAG